MYIKLAKLIGRNGQQSFAAEISHVNFVVGTIYIKLMIVKKMM